MRYWRTRARDKYAVRELKIWFRCTLHMFLIGRWGVANRMTLIIASLMVDRRHPCVDVRASQSPPKGAVRIGSLTPPAPLTRPPLARPAGPLLKP